MSQPNVLRQIRRFCMQCQGNSSAQVMACTDKDCALWTCRHGHSQNVEDDPNILSSSTSTLQRSALRIVRRHCLRCAENRTDVRACTARDDCPLWSLRFGVYPATVKRVRKRLAQPKRLSLFSRASQH